MKTHLALVALVLLAGFPMTVAQTYDTDDYLEWEQFLFTVNIGSGPNAKPTLTDAQFNITKPHAWSVLSGNTSVLVRGWISVRGDAITNAAWSPQVRFNNSIRHWLLDDSSGVDNGCILGEFVLPTSSGYHEYYPIDVECKLQNYTASGQHDLDIVDFANCAGSGCPDSADIHVSFVLRNREKVTYKQPDARPAAGRLETNLATANHHVNQTLTNLATANANINETNALIGQVLTDLDTIATLVLALQGGAPSASILRDSSGNGYDMLVQAVSQTVSGFPKPIMSSLANDTFSKWGQGFTLRSDGSALEGLITGFYDPVAPQENVSVFVAANIDSDNGHVELDWSDGGDTFNFGFYCDSGTLAYYHQSWPETVEFAYFTSPNECTGQHTLGFIRNHTVRHVDVYFDGVKVAQGNYTDDPPTASDNSFVVQSSPKNQTLYEVRLWDSAIAESDMLRLMNATDNGTRNALIGGEFGAWFFELDDADAGGGMQASSFQLEGLTPVKSWSFAVLLLLFFVFLYIEWWLAAAFASAGAVLQLVQGVPPFAFPAMIFFVIFSMWFHGVVTHQKRVQENPERAVVWGWWNK